MPKSLTTKLLIAMGTLLATAAAQEQPYISAKKLFYAEPDKLGGAEGAGRASGTATNAIKSETSVGPRQPRDGSTGAVTSDAGRTGASIRQTIAYSAPVTGLHYTVYQEIERGREIAVDPGRQFHSGERVRFEFESNIDGYLYVTQEGSSGKWNVLFPDERINEGMNQITHRKPYAVPSGKYFVFNDVPGTEKLMVFLNKSPINQLPSKAGTKTVERGVIDQLNSSFSSRDLVFEKDDGAPVVTSTARIPTASTYVVNSNASGQAVVITILLNHVQ